MRKIFLLLVVTFGCHSNSNNMHDYTNSLIHSTSPYLLQHAHNPVNWEEWGEDALNRAVEEDKPILVSIGYSSCHWCHVMEKESFEDTAIARIMNENFINIKVDREERPDVDQVYMDAVQAMGLNGGWPLNVFLTPDQKPFYGGTYFPRDGWKNLLTSIIEAFEKNRERINESAAAFTKDLQHNESEKYRLSGTQYAFTKTEYDSTFEILANKFDTIDGGIRKSPKFPMPSVWQYLASYHHISGSPKALAHLSFTLEKIANGGIYDQVGGGFARYSTDEEWHVPHFEKMLYDNGQLLSLYANGYKLTGNPKFKNVMLETIEWIRREMMDENGGFYSALDADSEGEEGKFYVWSYEEIQQLAGEDFTLIASYFDVQKEGNWEGKNVLRIVKSEDDICSRFKLTGDEFHSRLKQFKSKALTERASRVRPGLDDKIIAGWNGLTLSGLCDAYQALQNQSILTLADSNAEFIKSKLIRKGILYRFEDKNIEGFMEDYAAVIQAFIKYYETTFDRTYLDLARRLNERVDSHFYDATENLYYFTSDESQRLIARKKELFDNVIPSSNSIMAWNLVHLGTHFYDDQMVDKGKSMIAQVKHLIKQEPEYMSNWALLGMELSIPFAEIVMVGPEVNNFAKEVNQLYLPNKILTGSITQAENAPFEFKSMIDGKTTIYVCFDRACKLPVTTVSEALKQLGTVKAN